MNKSWAARWVSVGLLFGAAGCDDGERQQAIAELAPRMDEERVRLEKAQAALPEPGSETELACAAQPATAVTVSERWLSHHLGLGAELSKDEATIAERANRGVIGVLPPGTLARWKTDTDVVLGSVINAGRELERFAEVAHLVVVRTTAADAGQVTGKTIERNARWAGWVFVVDRQSAELLGAARAEAESGDRVYAMAEKGKKAPNGALLKDAVHRGLAASKGKLACLAKGGG